VEFKFRQVKIVTEAQKWKKKNAKTNGFIKVKSIVFNQAVVYPKKTLYYIGTDVYPCFYSTVAGRFVAASVEKVLKKSVLTGKHDKLLNYDYLFEVKAHDSI